MFFVCFYEVLFRFCNKKYLNTEKYCIFYIYYIELNKLGVDMDIVAGKNGSFFVVKGYVSEDIKLLLAQLTFADYGRCNAYETMKKISRFTIEQYAEKNSLDINVLKKFGILDEVVDYKATQELMFFIETETNREQLDSDRNITEIDPNNFKNGFLHPAPRELSGLLTDALEIKDEDVPQLLKRTGISIVRSVIQHFIKWNDITYKVDVIPGSKDAVKSAFNGKELIIGENCYIFHNDDWANIKKFEYEFKREKLARKNSWFKIDKPEDEIFEDVLKKLFKDKKQQLVVGALCRKYRELRKSRTDYRGIFIHEFHHLRNKLLIENRCLKNNSKALLAPDMYFIQVEDERSSYLAVTIDRINQYWVDHDWEKLLEKEPCFAILDSRSENERNKLLLNLDFVTNAKLKHWTENHLHEHLKRFVHRLPSLQSHCSVAKGIDEKRKEYLQMRSMLYSFWVYNPFTQRHKMVKLDKYIKIDIPVNKDVQENIIDKAQYYIDRKLSAKDMLGMKFGMGDRLIRKAANIYDSALRTKYKANLTS